MKHTAILLAVLCLILSLAFASWAQNAPAGRPSQTILRAGSQPPSKGPAENFTGDVTVAPLFPANASASYSGAYVTFEAGARSAWHTHPAGQHLVVTAGVGRTAEWGGRVQEIKTGDVIWCPPGVKHWHGASPAAAMTHLALTGTVNNKNVEWMEKVTDAQYNAEARAMNTTHALSAKQRGIIPIAAFTATGDQERLRTALNEGLEAGLTVNEIKEILVQMYAYAGFPRSLNGINAFMAVLEERKRKDITDTEGKAATPVAETGDKYERGRKTLEALTGQPQSKPAKGFGEFSPQIDRFLKEHLFADIFDSDVLTYEQRELATISALAAMPGVEAQLESHLATGMNTGLTDGQLKQVIDLIEKTVSRRQAETARNSLTKVIAAKQKKQ